MHRISKHVRRAAARQLITTLTQVLQVAGQGGTVAADVDDAKADYKANQKGKKVS